MIAIPDPNGRLGLPADLQIREERLQQAQIVRALRRVHEALRNGTAAINKMSGAIDEVTQAFLKLTEHLDHEDLKP